MNGIDINYKNNMPTLKRSINKNYEKAMLKAAIRVHRELAQTLTGSRSGNEYTIPATKKTYRASQPNEPPASRLGHLRNSYKYIVRGKGLGAVGYVGSNLDYSHYLEYGTSKMKPRPHLAPAFESAKKDVMKLFEGLDT